MAPVSGCLVIMCGVPCSGKSTAAAELASALSAKGIRTTTVDEPSLHLHRNAGYANGHVEKNTRGLLKATVDRSLHKDGPVVIVDACNGIKGYRYELWCIARQVGATVVRRALRHTGGRRARVERGTPRILNIHGRRRKRRHSWHSWH
jgi:protein KTI12